MQNVNKLGVACDLTGATLDPSDWPAFREQAHRMLDDMLGHIETVRERPLWTAMPEKAYEPFRSPMPTGPSSLEAVHQEFMEQVVPYALGNLHPGFMGWVHGGGTPVGMLAEMLAAGLNANLGGRSHAPIEVERQLCDWVRDLFHFPASAAGLCVTGTSMANLLAVKAARDFKAGEEIRREGVSRTAHGLRCYASTATHSCIAKAMDVTGIGSDALRLIPTNHRGQIDLHFLERMIAEDRASGLTPFLIIGNAGTVDTGSMDDLSALAEISRRQSVWFHVDGAFGALAMLSPALAPRLTGIERADSLAFDFHKWGQVPYDAGFLLVRDGRRLKQAFAPDAPAYLQREERGMAVGTTWPCDLGVDLSRGFRALKVWFTLKVYGAARLGAVIAETCELAGYLVELIEANSELELFAPVSLNIVCFGYRSVHSDEINRQVAIDMQECGFVAPSTTRIGGRVAIRAAIVNHRTSRAEIDTLITQALIFGRAWESSLASTENPADGSQFYCVAAD